MTCILDTDASDTDASDTDAPVTDSVAGKIRAWTWGREERPVPAGLAADTVHWARAGGTDLAALTDPEVGPEAVSDPGGAAA